MTQDSDYFRRRTAEARAAAFERDEGEGVEVAGHLALAYAALARRRKAAAEAKTVNPAEASAADDIPLMLRD